MAVVGIFCFKLLRGCHSFKMEYVMRTALCLWVPGCFLECGLSLHGHCIAAEIKSLYNGGLRGYYAVSHTC